MFKSKYKVSLILSVIIIVLAVIASAGGLLLEGLYRDNNLIKTAWQGNDLVTLFLVVPMMVGALYFFMRGSLKAQLIWLGTLWYMVYNYMFYLYAAAFNKFFLIYVTLFTISIYALIFALLKIDVNYIKEKFNPRTPVKIISSYLIFFALLLGGLWVAKCLSFVITGEVPLDIQKTGHPTGVVYATDLALLMPAVVFSAVLLWKKKAWGYVLSAIVMIKSFSYSLVLIVMSLISYIRIGIGDAYVSLWIILSGACILVICLLFGNIKKQA